jgi:murein DD-endopeptidase MepM/ murein hydrolase activator NlpD
VISAGWDSGGGGRTVKIKHDNGFTAIYCHLKGFSVKVGERVEHGARLGGVNTTGYSTGNHLHFALMKNGRYVNPQSAKGVNL